jgi:hypothetical protein
LIGVICDLMKKKKLVCVCFIKKEERSKNKIS